ncbi:MAG TPA: ATP synthase subunit I [Gammaproteobacteria bacterium]|nr:ATP synthase subunit I [Gammaproteobacteria bacterium]
MPKLPIRLVIGQLLTGLIAGGCWLFGAGLQAALAAFAGGAICALLSLYVAIRVFGHRAYSVPADTPEMAAKRRVLVFYRAEALKIFLAVVLFTVAAFFFKGSLLPLMTTYIAASLVYFAALLWVD